MKIRRLIMIANETTSHQRPRDVNISNYRSRKGLQQRNQAHTAK